MAHVNCPNCGKRLRFSDTSDPVRIRCPICKHTFRATAGSALTSQTLPASQSPAASDYSEANLGWVAKASMIVMALAGTALLGFLVYKVANTSSPGLNEEPPQEIVRAVKTEKDKPTPTTMVAKPATKLPKVTSKPVVMSPEELFAEASPAVVYIVVRDGNFKPTGLGSGFFVDEKGLIVTNYHVIKGAVFATARLSNGSTLFVDGVVATDPDSDVAIMKVSGPGFPFLKIAGGPLPKVGSAVYAIGNPRGLENTFSGGMVSGHREIKKGFTAIQVTTPISPGSSGGPLLNTTGEVVGVTTAYLKGGQNLNFAVPVAAVRRLIQKQGKVQTLASAGGGRLDKAETEELDKAWAAMEKKNWSAATKILIKLRKTQKDNPFVWFALGHLHSELKNYEIAIRHYKVAISLKPDYTSAYYYIGGAYRHLKRYTEAIAAYKQAIALKPDYAEAYFFIGVSYSSLKHYPEALAAYKQAITIKSNYAVAYYFMGSAYNKLKRYPEAIAAYQAAVRLDRNGECGMWAQEALTTKELGKAWVAIVEGDLREATRILTGLKEKQPDNASVWFTLGYLHGRMNQYAKAIAAYKKAIDIKPDYAKAYFLMGNAYRKMKQYPEAIAAYKAAIAINPKDAETYYCMGHAYRKMKQYPETIAAYKAVITINPKNTKAYFLMGFTYSEMKQYPEAIAAFKAIIDINPKNASAYYYMGEAYEKMGKHTEAIAAYQAAVRLDRNGISGLLAKGALKNIRRRRRR